MDLNYLRNVALALRKGHRLIGWSEIGSGHFSHVFHNAAVAPDVVIKLSGRGSYGDGDLTKTSRRTNPYYNDDMDDAYPLYAQWCMKHQHLRGVPKVYLCEQISRSLWLTVTEYVPHDFHSEINDQLECTPHWMHDGDYDWPWLELDSMLSAWGKAPSALRRANRRGEPYAATVMALRDLVRQNSDFIESDCHTGNVRFRDDGTMVFTDPIKGVS